MNSTMIKANCNSYFKGLDKATARKLTRQAVNYYEMGKTGDPQKLQSAYNALLAAVREGERVSGVQLIQSPDGSFLCALNAVSAFFQTLFHTENTISFQNLQQANDWLKEKTNLIITGVKIETRTSLGLLANHAKASAITLSYRVGTGEKLYRYGICQEEKTHLFLRRKDKEFVKKWEAANPGLECVSLQQTSNSRASASSQLFGFGLDYVEHVKYFITYRKPLSDS